MTAALNYHAPLARSCHRCRTPLLPNAGLCPHCGFAVVEERAVVQAVTPSSGEYLGNFAPAKLAAAEAARRQVAGDWDDYGSIPQGGSVLNNGYASWWQRLVASLIDSALIFGSLMVVVAILANLRGVIVSPGTSSPLVVIAMAFAFLLIPTLYATLDAGECQASIGKRIMGIIVCDTEGRRIGTLRVLGRLLCLQALGAMSGGLLGLVSGITIITSQRRQGLHDMICQTVVVRRLPR